MGRTVRPEEVAPVARAAEPGLRMGEPVASREGRLHKEREPLDLQR